MWILSGLGVGERSRRRRRGDVDLDRLFSLFLSLSTVFSPSNLVFSSSGLLSTFGFSLVGALNVNQLECYQMKLVYYHNYLFFWCFFNEPLERDEPDESDELEELDDDLESDEELLDDRELELLLLLLLDDLELLWQDKQELSPRTQKLTIPSAWRTVTAWSSALFLPGIFGILFFLACIFCFTRIFTGFPVFAIASFFVRPRCFPSNT